MVFITAGMGGGTGTAPRRRGHVARQMGALTVAVVTSPSTSRASARCSSPRGIQRLRQEVDTLITIPNQHLLKIAEKRTPIREAFFMADEACARACRASPT